MPFDPAGVSLHVNGHLLYRGGEPVACGWIRDRYGLSWQVTPTQALKLFASPDRAAAKRAMQAMMQMAPHAVGAIGGMAKQVLANNGAQGGSAPEGAPPAPPEG